MPRRSPVIAGTGSLAGQRPAGHQAVLRCAGSRSSYGNRPDLSDKRASPARVRMRYMIDVALPDDQAVPELTRSFAACMASVTETPVAEVPQPRADLPAAVAHWRAWLAGRGVGLVTLAKPAAFNWPGYWLAVLGQPGPRPSADDATAVL